MMWGDGIGAGGMVFMVLTGVGFLALVVVGIVMLVRGTAGSGPGGRDRGRDARQILDERFARGEIDADEYRSRLGLLPPAR